MKNMKKTLAVVLALAMVFSMGIASLAFEDVQDGTKVSEAVGILSNLGIIEGFEDGTFQPDESVTRAQMAAIICRTLGYEEQAQGSEGSTAFVDVAADHWASGYINVAQSLGIINGYGYGYYGPEDEVTYEQAVKMLVVALGYELDAQAKGGWSTGYMAVASREGITKSANGTVGAPALRGTIAVLVYNSLEVRLMDQQTWTTNGGDEYGKTDETILSQYLDVQKWEGVVTSVPYYDFAQDGYDEYADSMMTLSDAFYTEYDGGKLEKNTDYLGPVDCSLVADANTLIGKKVVAYIGADEDDETGNRMVYAIAEKQGANKTTTISATQLVESGDKYYSESDVIGYRNVGSTRINTLDLDDEVTIDVNFGSGSAGSSVNTTSELADLVDNGGTITFISNDSNSKIDYILVTTYSEEAIIEEVNVEDEMITFITYSGTLDDIDTEDEDTLVVVIRDGEVATVEDIEESDTVSIVGTDDFADDSFRVLYVSSKVITGKVTSYSNEDGVVSIGYDDYETSVLSGLAPADLSGEEGVFFLNVDGQIAWAESDSTSKGNYALLIAAGTTSGINGGYEVEVVLADGTIATYPLNTKAYIEAVDGTDSVKSDDSTYDALIADMTADGSAYRVPANKLNDYVFEITVKNGRVTKLARVEEGSDASGKDFDEENMSYGGISMDEATVVFSIEVSGSTPVESGDISVGYPSDFFVDGEGDEYSLIAFDENNSDIAGLVLGYGLTTTIPQDSDALIITSVKAAEINDYDAYVVRGMQGGKNVSYTICDEDEGYTGDEDLLKKGNIILLGVESSSGIVSDFEVLYDKDAGIQVSDNASDEIYYVAGVLDEDSDRKPSSSKFYLLGAEGSYYDDEDGITMKSSANYTLVDYSESSTNPEVSKKSKGTSIFGTLSKYDSEVFVRYYDDSLVEVVVYRYNNGDVEIPEEDDEEIEEEPIVVAAPTASPASGAVVNVGDVITLSTETEGAGIYYTTNGAPPHGESGILANSVEILASMATEGVITVKAATHLEGTLSEVSTFTYTLAEEEPQLPMFMASAPGASEPDEPMAEESKVDEPKAEEPKVEEPKAEEPKVEEPKAEEPKVEEPKVEEPKVEEPKVEEPKVEEPKVEEPKVEEPKVEEPKVEEPKAEEPKAEEPKAEEPKVEEPKAEEPKVEEPKVEEPKVEEPKVETPKKIEKVVIPNAVKFEKAPALKSETANIEKAPASIIESAAALVKTNINTATYSALVKLEGITDSLATKIIEYRAKNGEFKAVEDIKNVDGITDTIYDKIKAIITV